MNHNFSNIPAPEIQRSVFDRSHGHKTTLDSGYLVPVFIDEVLPGDTVNLKMTAFGRLSTLLFPAMDNIFLDTFFFFVPNRLLWENWEKFMGARANPNDSIDYTIPQLNNDETLSMDLGSVGDYFGIPTDVTFPLGTPINALPFRAYNLIWNSWFRDQNLQDSAIVPLDDGPDLPTIYPLLRRGKRHDYFTSCLPWPQKGDPVSIGLAGTAPVIGNGMTMGWQSVSAGSGDEGPLMGSSLETVSGIKGHHLFSFDAYGTAIGTSSSGFNGASYEKTIGLTGDPDKSGVIADLTGVAAITVNALREAFQIQKILERDARGGTRYVELLKAHFGVTNPDFRLQRPEYLGGSSARMDISAVAQTSESTTTKKLGQLAAFSTVGDQAGFHHSITEHGYIIGLVNVRADITYQQGLHKMWSRATRYDFYLPALANLGEQAVLNQEIMVGTSEVTNEAAFGYQERWAEYRYKPSFVSGKFRSNAAGTLDSWHLALDFVTLPPLNDEFIQDDPPIERIVAVTTEPQVILDTYFKIRHARPMPVYSVPGQIDRF